MKSKIVTMAFAIGMTMIMLLSAMSVGCDDPPPAEEKVRCEYDLIAGNFAYTAGEVVIQEMLVDGKYDIWVTFNTVDGWYLDETHVHLAYYIGDGTSWEWDDYDWDGAVGNNGNPKPGKFDYYKDHGTGVTSYTHKIATQAASQLELWDIAIAAHAVVYKWEGDYYNEQTAWGQGKEFPKSWAMFMLFPCYKVPTTPETATFKGQTNIADAYWNFQFYGVDSGYYLTNGYYDGWCMEETVYMYPNTEYTATIIPSLPDEGLSAHHQTDNGNWHMVNWIINHKGDYLGTTGYNKATIQTAIWWFFDETTSDYPSNSYATDLIKDAEANGANFWPTQGQYMCMIMESGESIQGCFFELDP